MKLLIVGAGVSGSCFARLAAEQGITCHIIDKRVHIGGNCYTYTNDLGIEIHAYGPHIFHTSSKQAWAFVNRFASFNSYVNRVKALSAYGVFSLPINLHTINQFFGKTMGPSEAESFIEKKRIRKTVIDNFEDYILDSVGEELYEAFFKHYSTKHWGIDPKEIPVSTAKRLPVRFNYNDNYYNDTYQGIPVEGYTAMFRTMLDNPLITVETGVSFEEFRSWWRKRFDALIFTGSIDDYFGFEFGPLPYRTVTFRELRDKEIQGTAVINYTDNRCPFTRIHEHKWFTPDKRFDMSVGFEEYPADDDSRGNPYYPVRTHPNIERYEWYRSLAAEEKDVLFLGRLGEYSYIDMDRAVDNAFHAFDVWFETVHTSSREYPRNG